MAQFEEYKARIKSDDWTSVKEKVNRILADKHLASIMNDTKWLELQSAIDDLPFPPPYIMKEIINLSGISGPDQISDAPWYHGDWSNYWEEGMPPFFNIEWIKVRPRYSEKRGRLIDDKIWDETEEFVAILKKYHIPYEEENGTFVIYGYK